jgi:hypothetical protein
MIENPNEVTPSAGVRPGEEPHPDAELLRYCAMLEALEQRRRAIQREIPEDDAEHAAALARVHALQKALAKRIRAYRCVTRDGQVIDAITMDGIRAKQRSLNLWRRHENASDARERRKAALLAEAKAEPTRKMLVEDLRDEAAPLARAIMAWTGADMSGDEHRKREAWSALASPSAEYDKAVRRAFRAGHHTHPYVLEWLATQRALGGTASLRALKNAGTAITRGRSAPRGATTVNVWIQLAARSQWPDLGCDQRPQPKVTEIHCALKRLFRARWLPDSTPGFMGLADEPNFWDRLEGALNAKRGAFEKRLVALGLHVRRDRQRK